VDSTMRMATAVELPPNAFLRFAHGYGFDKDARRRYDGGVVEIQVDGGPWRGVGALFTHGRYNGTIAKGTGNPLAGQRAFTGNSRGWSKARVSLARFAGKRVKVRFRMASDRRVGSRGWYIDDIRIYTCAADGDKPTATLTIDGGAESTAERRVLVTLDYADATTWVSHIRVSSSPKVKGGTLLKGITMEARETLQWDLADTTYGSTGARGPRRVYAQVRDEAGNWSAVVSDVIEWVAPQG
jgi:hypothetical protein